MHAHPLIGNAENTGNINAAGAPPAGDIGRRSRTADAEVTAFTSASAHTGAFSRSTR
jgi:hypothetical protein